MTCYVLSISLLIVSVVADHSGYNEGRSGQWHQECDTDSIL